MIRDGQKLTAKQVGLIAALLTEPNHSQAAAKTGVSEATLYRWLRLPEFASAYRQARREVVDSAVGRMQAATGQAVDTLLSVTKTAVRDNDRVRAAMALLEHAYRGLTAADALGGDTQTTTSTPINTAEVVKVLSHRLRQVDEAELPIETKSRLTASLSDSLLRAIHVDVLEKRLEALEAVLTSRKE